MSQFIIELGSANEHHNDIGYLRDMIDAVIDCDTGKHSIVMKHQLFEHAGGNEPLLWRTFAWAYGYACERGYPTTASVFDITSLHFLERFDVPFVKIACVPKLYWLARKTDRHVYLSVNGTYPEIEGETHLACVRSYPADAAQYVHNFSSLKVISDHTEGWGLYKRYLPVIIEKHFCLKRSSDNPDSGPFAVTPKELAEVL
jgi:sialic acid synthase SpsE